MFCDIIGTYRTGVLDLKRRILQAAAWILTAALTLTAVFGGVQTGYAAELKLKGKSAVLIDAGTGEILYEKNADEQLRPASMTKMMTAILVCENLQPDDIVTVSKYVTTIDGSALGLKKGEKITVEDLLNVMLIYSANDCAVALAEAVSGSVEEFAALMNKRAEELGCTGTHFVNPNGLDADGHVSTARDMAIIAKKAMEIPEIREIVQRTTYQIHKTNKRDVLAVGTTDRLLFDTYSWINVNGKSRHPYYKYAIGIKTGYTDRAGGCMAAAAVKGDEEYISIVMKSTAFDRFADSIELLEYGFDNFDRYKAVSAGDSYDVKVKKGKEKTVRAEAEEDVSAVIEEGADTDSITCEVTYEENRAPVKKGDVVGTVTVFKDGSETGSTRLIASENVSRSILKTVFASPWIYIAAVSAFVCYIAYISVRSRIRKKRRHRK